MSDFPTIPGGYYAERLPDGRMALFRGPMPPGKRQWFTRLSQAEWDERNMRTLSCRVRTATARQFRQAAARNGMTPYAVLREYVEEYIQRNTPRPPGGTFPSDRSG